uniref:MULE transposase domain-containing protein n=1 Tax=Tanacetum cinerariifolium TaxID=118510 RepID=A0A6L2M4H1_TANCI|nr:hypothetical protein [Tanacetum cinerariifolium]
MDGKDLSLAFYSLKTPKAVIHHEFLDTPCGSVYWVPRVSASVLPILGTVYDNLDECIEDLFIIKAANANIGAVRAHNLYTGLKGSSSLVHEDAELCGLFWADEVAKCNYKEFGDIVSFDATYKTNKNKMVFVPFTAIDNHMIFVTVDSGLLKKETAKAYRWLLRAFKKAFVCPPTIVVTDQDEAMRLAVAVEFPESKHRLCMWHIMQKILANVFAFETVIVSRIYDDTDFKDKFGKIVCNIFIGPEEFEDRWNKLMEEFNLINHKWLSKMYHLRSSWVPAFFVDSLLCRLMRTTSRYFITKEMVQFLAVVSFLFALGFYDLIPPNLRNKKNRYGEKNEVIEKFAMEASIILDSCVHMLRNNEPKLSVFVNKMKAIKSKLETELPIVPTRIVSNFVQEFMGVKKPDKVKVKNPTGVRPKGRKKQNRIKSGREISMKKSVKKRNKKLNGCGICGSTAHNRRTSLWKNDVDVLYHAVVIPGDSDHIDGGSE